MDFFSKMGETLSTKGKAATQKAKDIAELTKLSTQVGQLEGKIKSWYQVIGEKVYQSEKDQEHAGLEVEFNMITDAFAEIGRIKKQIAELKGVQVCPGCKAEVPADALFCPKCGAKQEKEALVKEAEAEAAEECSCAEDCCCEEAPAEDCGCTEDCCCGEAPAEDCGCEAASAEDSSC
ncbi:MAG: hypothetical protein IJ390_13915 [Lachnospiraceae bacterium]|nr:hypothetical protein [Lachnospiraceae bacterium]